MELPVYLFIVALWAALGAYWFYLLALVLSCTLCTAYCYRRCGCNTSSGAMIGFKVSSLVCLTALVLAITWLMSG